MGSKYDQRPLSDFEWEEKDSGKKKVYYDGHGGREHRNGRSKSMETLISNVSKKNEKSKRGIVENYSHLCT